MSNNTQASGGGLGCGSVLCIVFIVLKLTGNIAWSWWWVLAPVWLPLSICIPILALCYWAGARR